MYAAEDHNHHSGCTPKEHRRLMATFARALHGEVTHRCACADSTAYLPDLISSQVDFANKTTDKGYMKMKMFGRWSWYTIA